MIETIFTYFFVTVAVTLGMGVGIGLCAFCYVTLEFYLKKLLKYLEKIQKKQEK